MRRSNKVWIVGQFPVNQIKKIKQKVRESELDLELYCPTRKVHQSRKGIVYNRDVPLFANYIFLRYNPEVLSRADISSVVPIRVLIRNGRLCQVTKLEIDRIKDKEYGLKREDNLLRSSPKYLKRYIGRQVLVRDGLFDGTLARVVGVVGAGRLKVEIFLFQRNLTCDMDIDYVELN